MSTVEEITQAIAMLPKDDFWKLTDQLLKMRDDHWDAQIQADAAAGKLDFLFEEADKELREGGMRTWPDLEKHH